MKLKEFEWALQEIKQFDKPKVKLEQYPTSAHLASRVIFNAENSYGDIEDKSVLDLGCGPCILGIAAQMFGSAYTMGIDIDIDALNIARNIDIDQAEAILRVEMGSKVSEMSSKEIKRDLLIFAKQDAKLFIDLAKDDNVQLRNFAIKATEAGIIKLADDQRTFKWSSNNKKLMTVPFDEHPYAAMAAFFKTDEGLEIYKSIEKKLS